MGDFLTATQVRDEFGFSRSTLLRWEDEGLLLPDKTPGGHRRYHREAILDLIEESHPQLDPPDRYRELGSSGEGRYGTLFEENLRELRGNAGHKLYREMRLNDPVIAAMFFALTHALKQAAWQVTPASDKRSDKKAAEFLEECLHDMSFSWHDALTFMIDPMLEQGISILEIVYKKRLGETPPAYIGNPAPSQYDDGRIGWRKFAPRPVESLAVGQEFIKDRHGGIQGINQVDPDNYQLLPLPIEKLLMFRTTVHPANSTSPPPIHRAAYLPYYFTKNLMEIEGIGVERDLAGIPVIYLGKDRSFAGVDSDYEIAKDLVVNLRRDEQTGIVFPGPKMGGGAAEGDGWLLELISSNSGRSYDTGAIIDRYDRRKALVVLAQFIMLGMDNVGSYALSKHQGDLFILAATSWLKGVAETLNRHAVPKLIRLNMFGNLSGYPQLSPSAIGVPDLSEIADYVNRLVEKRVITPDEELEQHLRILADLPEFSGERQAATVTSPRDDQTEDEEPAEGDQPEEVEKGHNPGILVDVPCPFCLEKQTSRFEDHGGAHVCPTCQMTFHPEFFYD